MAGFIKATEEVQNTPFKQHKFENVGDEVTLYLVEMADATSAEYGDFTVLQGLGFDPEAESLEKALDGAYLVSFPNQTVIDNRIKNGAIRFGEAYRIVMKWRKGDKYDNGKKTTKSNGYDIFLLELDDDAKKAFRKKYNELLGRDAGIVSKQVPVSDKPATPSANEPTTEPRL